MRPRTVIRRTVARIWQQANNCGAGSASFRARFNDEQQEHRMKRLSITIASVILAATPAAFAANKEMVELQRDMALLQDQVRSVNDKLTTLSTLVQQALDNTRQSNTAIAVMQSN